ncbi:MAG TPA: hypothetical protein VFE62_20180 [Gemmataceae bacterium]|nr:hypothetical protein [Gemmataceae bacterium]
MRRIAGWGIALVIALVVIDLLSLWPLCFGWYRVIARVGPEIEISYAGVATAVVCIGAVVIVLHWLARWLYGGLRLAPTRADWPETWRWKWTLCLVAAVMLMFVAGLAGVGVFRTTSWFLEMPRIARW